MSDSEPEVREVDKDGDIALFRELYPRTRRFAAFVAPKDVEPDDLVQEALARVLERGSLQTIAEPLGYLRTTMLNIVRNEHRRRGREVAALERLPMGNEVDDPADTVTGLEATLDALNALSPRSRALVFLVDVEDQPIDAAAALVGLSSTAARTRLSRSRRTLRRLLDVSEATRP